MAAAAEQYHGCECAFLPRQDELLPELEVNRYLTEIDHLIEYREGPYKYSKSVLDAIKTNLFTAVQEGAMPYAVTETVQYVENYVDPQTLRQKRKFMWLGRCAVDVAESGRGYHFSDAAMRRVEVEIAEAEFSQDYLRPGFAQVFISPRMSAADAPKEIAEAEHLYDDDAIRTSQCVTDEQGSVIGRLTKSLLVRGIPLEAWTSMLLDSNNIFGKTLPIRDINSARSVMELFQQMELPESALPEGPVTILEAVLPYVFDVESHDDLEQQITEFKKNQTKFREEAMYAAGKWLSFEKELAESLVVGQATDEIRKFIITQSQTMDKQTIDLINNHHLGDTQYIMTRELAAILEKRKQNVQKVRAGVAVETKYIVSQIAPHELASMQADMKYVRALEDSGVKESEIKKVEAKIDQKAAKQKVETKGGCAGKNSNLGSSQKKQDSSNQKNSSKSETNTKDNDRNKWKKKQGLCVVKACPTRPKKVKVGPCGVCMDRCQKIFDRGGDPTKMGRHNKLDLRKTSSKVSHTAQKTEKQSVAPVKPVEAQAEDALKETGLNFPDDKPNLREITASSRDRLSRSAVLHNPRRTQLHDKTRFSTGALALAGVK